MSSTILNKSDENGHPHCVLSFRGKHYVFHIKYDIICRLPVGFYKCSLSSLYQVEKTVLVLVCWECLLWKSIGFCQKLSCVNWYNHMVLFFILLIWWITIKWFSNIEPVLTIVNYFQLVVLNNFSYTLLCSICYYFV